jgi:hypothetical protein
VDTDLDDFLGIVVDPSLFALKFDDLFSETYRDGSLDLVVWQGGPVPFLIIELFVVRGFVRAFGGLISETGELQSEQIRPVTFEDVEELLRSCEDSPKITRGHFK